MKVVVARLIQDVEGKDKDILELERETISLKHEIELLKKENDNVKHSCEKLKVQENSEKCDKDGNSKENVKEQEEYIHLNLSSFRFDFSKSL